MELHLPPKPTPTVLPGEFRFAAAGLAHGHIYGMVNGLLDAGAELVGVWDEDLPRINTYGLPLDSRADYTKSDWICWTARMADDAAVRTALIAPIAKELRETTSRVPFSDWYDTKTGRYVAFIARSVQGGIFALML